MRVKFLKVCEFIGKICEFIGSAHSLMFKLDIVVMEMESQLIMLLDFTNGLLRLVVLL